MDEEEKIIDKEDESFFEDEEKSKDEFEKEEELVAAGKYNAAVRKQREIDLEKRELEKKVAEYEKKLAEYGTAKKDIENEDEDSERKVDIEPISKELKELREKIDKRDLDDKKTQRDAFFKSHPEYLSSVKWQELLDEMDNSLNPHSKDSYYKQLTKAHRLISGNSQNSEVEKKKAEMASEMSGKGDGSQKATHNKTSLDERSLRLASKMPKGYEFKKS